MYIGGNNMLVQEINQLREKLNEKVESCSLDTEGILALSQDLDVLITEYYRCSLKKSKLLRCS